MRMELLWVHPQQPEFTERQQGIVHTALVLQRNLQKDIELNILLIIKLLNQPWVGSGGKQT